MWIELCKGVFKEGVVVGCCGNRSVVSVVCSRHRIYNGKLFGLFGLRCYHWEGEGTPFLAKESEVLPVLDCTELYSSHSHLKLL